MKIIFRNNIYYKNNIITSILIKIINNYSIGLLIIPSSIRENGIFIQINRDFNRL